jgi:hypothetical protein
VSRFAARILSPPVSVPRGCRRSESITAPLAGAARDQFAWISVERQRGYVAHVAWAEANVCELTAVHVGQRPKRRPRGGDAEWPGRRSSRAGAK